MQVSKTLKEKLHSSTKGPGRSVTLTVQLSDGIPTSVVLRAYGLGRRGMDTITFLEEDQRPITTPQELVEKFEQIAPIFSEMAEELRARIS